MSPERRLFRAAAAADAEGVFASPAAVLVESESGRLPILLASGSPEAVLAHPGAAGAIVRDLGDAVLLPGLINAHTHLDLTHIGPRPFDPALGFAGWARMIIAHRLAESTALEGSVLEGIRLSLAGGVVAVGDIAGVMQLQPAHTLAASGMLGVSFVECFGLGARQDQTIAQLGAMIHTLGMSESASESRGDSRVRLGLQPHAPYTAGPRLMRWTAEQRRARGIPICTHLAESIAEREFIARGTGPFRELLEQLGLWNDAILEECARGEHPVAHLATALRIAPWLLAHVNDCDDAGLRILAETGASVAYCPRSSHYFHNHESFGPHRYRDMLAAGINVCLGTDSIVNLPPEESDRISTLDEMRFLFRRDGTDPLTLLRMATVNGARALGLDPALFTLQFEGELRPIAGLIAVNLDSLCSARPPLERVARSKGPPVRLA